ncbi:nuclear transport factor 2 family protein [Silvibacterium sp.]|uniref:nuclear transport factor 2 family protein n=1 Tax=Silvibacterium sp. TaxID=1964179 RepID=UPI0039E66B6D
MKITPADIALEFIDMINRHDLSCFEALTTEDFLFIDAEGSRMPGRKPLLRSLRAYFAWFPDYSIEVEQSFASGSFAMITGLAMGTPMIGGEWDKAHRWRSPSAWQAIVHSGRIAEWRVYADNRLAWQAIRGKQARQTRPPLTASEGYSLLLPE